MPLPGDGRWGGSDAGQNKGDFRAGGVGLVPVQGSCGSAYYVEPEVPALQLRKHCALGILLSALAGSCDPVAPTCSDSAVAGF